MLQTLPHPVAPALSSTGATTRQYLFDGTSGSFDRWRRIGGGTTFTLIDGQIVTLGQGDFSLLYYTLGTFENFVLRLKFMVSNVNDNSGVFVRFRDPLLRPTAAILAQDTFQNIPSNKAWIAVYSGFEVQIDDQARGDSRINESNGLNKNRTGAIYKMPAGDGAEPKAQEYSRGPILQPWQWYQYELAVQSNVYTVKLGPEGGALVQTTRFKSLDARMRGRQSCSFDTSQPPSGRCGLRFIRNMRFSVAYCVARGVDHAAAQSAFAAVRGGSGTGHGQNTDRRDGAL